MSKTPAKVKNPKDSTDKTDAANGGGAGRSRLKLALFALVPLVALGGAGYAGWAYVFEPHAEASGGEPQANAIDLARVSALLPDTRPQFSATHSYAISVLIAERCGEVEVPSLKAASDGEAAIDGPLVSASWAAAAARTRTLDERSCTYLIAEVENAEWKASQALAQSKASAGH